MGEWQRHKDSHTSHLAPSQPPSPPLPPSLLLPPPFCFHLLSHHTVLLLLSAPFTSLTLPSIQGGSWHQAHSLSGNFTHRKEPRVNPQQPDRECV